MSDEIEIESFLNHKSLVPINQAKDFISDEHFSILHVNVRSLADKFEELANLDVKFSCKVISETWLLENNFLDHYFIDGYNLLCSSRKLHIPK